MVPRSTHGARARESVGWRRALLYDGACAQSIPPRDCGLVTAWARVACDVDQCWVRRQYAPRNYPPLHSPHGWHQDGALRFDLFAYSGLPFPPDAVLDMVTCWIPLIPCGVEAPGLEVVTRWPEGLLAPADLTDECVRARFAPETFLRPAMKPGDALLFRGDILHRTHVTPAMTKDRTSIELRFFPAHNIPARLKGDHFIGLD